MASRGVVWCVMVDKERCDMLDFGVVWCGVLWFGVVLGVV